MKNTSSKQVNQTLKKFYQNINPSLYIIMNNDIKSEINKYKSITKIQDLTNKINKHITNDNKSTIDNTTTPTLKKINHTLLLVKKAGILLLTLPEPYFHTLERQLYKSIKMSNHIMIPKPQNYDDGLSNFVQNHFKQYYFINNLERSYEINITRRILMHYLSTIIYELYHKRIPKQAIINAKRFITNHTFPKTIYHLYVSVNFENSILENYINALVTLINVLAYRPNGTQESGLLYSKNKLQLYKETIAAQAGFAARQLR